MTDLTPQEISVIEKHWSVFYKEYVENNNVLFPCKITELDEFIEMIDTKPIYYNTIRNEINERLYECNEKIDIDFFKLIDIYPLHKDCMCPYLYYPGKSSKFKQDQYDFLCNPQSFLLSKKKDV